MQEKVDVRFSDEKHVWVNGRQFVRLDRFLEIKTNTINELEFANQECERLYEENESLKKLLKDKLNKVGE